MKNATSFLIIWAFLTSTVALAQPFSEKRMDCLEKAGLHPAELQKGGQAALASVSAKVSSQIFRPDSISFETSHALGMPFEITNSNKNTYDQQNRPIFIRHRRHHWSGITQTGTTQITYNTANQVTGYTSLSNTPTFLSFKFEQQFDNEGRLTSQKNYLQQMNGFQLNEGDSLEYLVQNGQVSAIIDRKYAPQLQQWILFQRYTNLQYNPLNQRISGFRLEAWDSTQNNWMLSGDFKSLAWEINYEGIHQIAQLSVFYLVAHPFIFPAYQQSTSPFPSNLVYGIDQGQQFDTLWHYQQTLAGGRVVRIDRDYFTNATRQSYDRIFLGYDGFGLPSSEYLQAWTGTEWRGNVRKESTRNAQQNIVIQRDSAMATPAAIMQPNGAYQYVYDSLPTGEISQFTRIDLQHIIPYPFARSRFWYQGLQSTVKNIHDPNLQVFPNPFNQGIWIEGLPSGTQLKCFNGEGKLVYETAIADEKQWVDVSTLPTGLYLLQFSAPGYLSSRKVLKTH